MSDTFEELVKHLLEHSIRTGDFTLKSGRKSTWFCDAKQTACRPEGILLIADAALEIIPDDITAIGGLTAGADPVAFGIAAAAAAKGPRPCGCCSGGAARLLQRQQAGPPGHC